MFNLNPVSEPLVKKSIFFFPYSPPRVKLPKMNPYTSPTHTHTHTHNNESVGINNVRFHRCSLLSSGLCLVRDSRRSCNITALCYDYASYLQVNTEPRPLDPPLSSPVGFDDPLSDGVSDLIVDELVISAAYKELVLRETSIS